MAKILVVDDRPANRLYLATLLGYGGNEVLEAADGKEALGIVRSVRPDLVITDILMPAMDGREFALAVRSDPVVARTPIIFYSATYRDKEARALARSAGVEHVLPKPSEPQVILDAVSLALHVAPKRLPPTEIGHGETGPLRALSVKLSEKVGELDSVTLRLTALLDLTLRATSERSLTRLVDEFCRSGRDLLTARYCGVALVSDPTGEPEDPYVSGLAADTVRRPGQVLDAIGGVGRLQRGDPVRLSEIDPRPDLWGLPAGSDPFRSFLAFPISRQETSFGALYVVNKVGVASFTEDDERIGATLASQLGIAYENALLYDEVERRAAELQLAEAKYRSLIEQSPAVTYIASLGGDSPTIYVSQQIEALIGYRPDEWIADPILWRKRIHPEDRERVLGDLQRSQATGEPFLCEYRLVARNDSEVWVRDQAIVVRDEAGQELLIQGIMLDVTVQKRGEAETRRRLQELEAIQRISTALRAASTLDEMLPRLVEETIAVLGAGSGSIWLYEASQDELVLAAQSGWGSDPVLPLRPGESIPGHVFQTGQPYLTQDLKHDPLIREETRARIPPGLSGACVPIRARADVIGALLVQLPPPRRATEAESGLLTTLAEIAGNAIHRARLFGETRRRLEHMQALRSIDIAISGSVDIRVTLDIVVGQVLTTLKADAADILRLNPHSRLLEHVVGKGFRTSALRYTHLRVGEGHAGQAALERRIVHIEDLEQRPEAFSRSSLLQSEGFRAYFGAPLVAKGQLKGVLEVFYRQPFRPDAEWLLFLEALAGQAAIAVDNADLFEGLERSNVDLRMAYDRTLEGWSRALDLRDKETEGHTQRVVEMTIRLAVALGIRDEELVHIRRGALLHDMGKMGIPDSILLKPGPLNDEEWVIMRKHPTYAYEMLTPISYLRPALDIPYCHHEKWDGTGYPQGLRGEEIPNPARIFAIADVWDALRSDRPYRKGWTEEETLKHVHNQIGTHFDPKVAAAFLQHNIYVMG